MHSVLQWIYQLLKVIAAVQATTNDQVVLQPTMGGSLPYIYLKITKSQYYLSSYCKS
jgi:hypothetical protein